MNNMEQIQTEEVSAPEARPSKAKIGIAANEPVSEAVRKYMTYHYAKMVAHEAGSLRGEDIEEVHDMRVATRRMRSIFSLFKGAFEKKAVRPYRQGLKHTAHALGAVRDLDVLIEKTIAYVQGRSLKNTAGMDKLLAVFEAQRKEAQHRLETHLGSAHYTQFKKDFEVFLKTPYAGSGELMQDYAAMYAVYQFAPLMLYGQSNLIRSYAGVVAAGQTEVLHMLRIEFKRLRYTMEFFSEVLDPASKSLIERIKRIQDHLGDLNDAQVARKQVQKVLGGNFDNHLPAPLTPAETAGISRYLIYREKEKLRLIKHFPPVWRLFDSQSFRYKLAKSIRIL